MKVWVIAYGIILGWTLFTVNEYHKNNEEKRRKRKRQRERQKKKEKYLRRNK